MLVMVWIDLARVLRVGELSGVDGREAPGNDVRLARFQPTPLYTEAPSALQGKTRRVVENG